MTSLPPPLHVLKFGGSSLATAASMRRVAALAADAARTSRVMLVASATGDTTDRLVDALDAPDDVAGAVAPLAERHEALAGALLPAEEARAYGSELHARLGRLRALLRHWHLRPTAALRDDVLATGERLSVPLLARLLRTRGLAAIPVDAAPLIQTDAQHGHALVQRLATYQRVRTWHAVLPANAVPVVTGFVGATPMGQTTTLGRGGSDYTAALLGAALDADLVERYTDVDGLYTADPRTDPSARRLRHLYLTDALHANQAGRLGMHPHTLDPLLGAGVPLRVRSTHAPDDLGTLLVPPARPPEARAA